MYVGILLCCCCARVLKSVLYHSSVIGHCCYGCCCWCVRVQTCARYACIGASACGERRVCYLPICIRFHVIAEMCVLISFDSSATFPSRSLFQFAWLRAWVYNTHLLHIQININIVYIRFCCVLCMVLVHAWELCNLEQMRAVDVANAAYKHFSALPFWVRISIRIKLTLLLPHFDVDLFFIKQDEFSLRILAHKIGFCFCSLCERIQYINIGIYSLGSI